MCTEDAQSTVNFLFNHWWQTIDQAILERYVYYYEHELIPFTVDP